MNEPLDQPESDEPWFEVLDVSDAPAPPPRAVSYHSGYHRDEAPTSRELVLGWCLWLLGSWMVTLLVDSAAPAVRWMVFAAMIGLMVMWPAVRLSQDARLRRHAEDRETTAMSAWLILRDWLCLILVFQAVVWPLRITGRWPMHRRSGWTPRSRRGAC